MDLVHDTTVEFAKEDLTGGIDLPEGWQSIKDDDGNVVQVSGPCPTCFGPTHSPLNEVAPTLAPVDVPAWFEVTCNCGFPHSDKGPGSCGRTWLVKAGG